MQNAIHFFLATISIAWCLSIITEDIYIYIYFITAFSQLCGRLTVFVLFQGKF